MTYMSMCAGSFQERKGLTGWKSECCYCVLYIALLPGLPRFTVLIHGHGRVAKNGEGVGPEAVHHPVSSVSMLRS